MCKWGTNTPLEVTIPSHLSSTGAAKRKIVDVDSCVAPLVKALNDAGVSTIASCCGHGHLPPTIAVEWNGDKDRWLVMVSRAEMEQIVAAYGVDIHGNPLTSGISKASREGDELLARLEAYRREASERDGNQDFADRWCDAVSAIGRGCAGNPHYDEEVVDAALHALCDVAVRIAPPVGEPTPALPSREAVEAAIDAICSEAYREGVNRSPVITEDSKLARATLLALIPTATGEEMSRELKPCPFCGGETVTWVARCSAVTCQTCGASGAPCSGPKTGIASWNQRDGLVDAPAAGASETVTRGPNLRCARCKCPLLDDRYSLCQLCANVSPTAAVRADSAPAAHSHQWVASPAPTTIAQRQGFVCSACGLFKSEEN